MGKPIAVPRSQGRHDRAQSARVIQTVEQAAISADIPNVARHPLPNCVLMEFGPNYGRYALRYWLIDPRPDDPTDSAVRVHVLAAFLEERVIS